MAGIAEIKTLGDEAVRAKNYLEALKYYDEAIKIEATAPLFSNRSLVHLKLQKYEDAADDALSAIGLDPTWAKPYARLSEAKKRLGEMQDALGAIAKAIKIEPENQTYKKIFIESMKIFETNVSTQRLVETFGIFETTGTGIMGYEDFKQMRRMARDMNPDNFSMDEFYPLLTLYGSTNTEGFDYKSWCTYLENHPEEHAHINSLTFMPSLINFYDAISHVEKNSNFSPQISRAIANFLNTVLFRYRLQDKPRFELAFVGSDNDPSILNQLKIPNPKDMFHAFYSAFIGVPNADSSIVVFAVNWKNYEGGFQSVNHHLGYLENGNMKSLTEEVYAGVLIKVFEFFDISWTGCVKIELSSKLSRLSQEKLALEVEKLLGRHISVEINPPSFGNMMNPYGIFN